MPFSKNLKYFFKSAFNQDWADESPDWPSAVGVFFEYNASSSQELRILTDELRLFNEDSADRMLEALNVNFDPKVIGLSADHWLFAVVEMLI